MRAVEAPVVVVRNRVGFRLRPTPDVSCAAEMVSFWHLPSGQEHVAIVVPPLQGVPLVRVHSECLTGDLFGSARCDCGEQLSESFELFHHHGGVLLYMRQEGRGIGLYNKLDAYRVQDGGLDTFAANRYLGRGADERSFSECASMLKALDLGTIRLLSNNEQKRDALTAEGINVVEMVSTEVHLTEENSRYLRDKAAIAGHRLALESHLDA